MSMNVSKKVNINGNLYAIGSKAFNDIFCLFLSLNCDLKSLTLSLCYSTILLLLTFLLYFNSDFFYSCTSEMAIWPKREQKILWPFYFLYFYSSRSFYASLFLQKERKRRIYGLNEWILCIDVSWYFKYREIALKYFRFIYFNDYWITLNTKKYKLV